MKKIVPFTVEHGRALDIAMPLRKLHECAQEPSFTLLVDNKVICAFGIIRMWEGVALAWGLVGSDFRKYSIFATRTIRKILRDMQRAFNLERIEAQSIQNPNHEKWLELVGFKREYGIARKYANGKNATRFEYIRGDND